jgi:hypothetical protein
VREQLLTELRAETWAALDAAEQVAIHRATYDLGQEEGHIRARSSKAGDSQELARQGRTLAFRARVNDAREAAEVHAVIADAEVTGDPRWSGRCWRPGSRDCRHWRTGRGCRA